MIYRLMVRADLLIGRLFNTAKYRALIAAMDMQRHLYMAARADATPWVERP